MRLPFNGINRITQSWSHAHYGLDIVGDDNKAVFAVCSGKVITSTIVTDKNNRTWEWGNYVRVDGDDGKRYFYCHLASRAVKAGQRVYEGDIIGIMGNTGKSYGAHLHLQIRNSAGKELNVAEILKIKNISGTLVVYNGNTQTPPNPAPSNVCKLLIGFVSSGDRTRVEELARQLQVPCIVQSEMISQRLVKLLVGYVSSGDKAKFEKLAWEMSVPCVVV